MSALPQVTGLFGEKVRKSCPSLISSAYSGYMENINNLNAQHKAIIKHYKASSYKLQTRSEPIIIQTLNDTMKEIIATSKTAEISTELWWAYCDAIGDFASAVADECASLQAKAYRLWSDIKEVHEASINLTAGI